MFGFVCCHSEEQPRFRVIEGTQFRAVYVTPGRSLRARMSCHAAARALRRDGVREAVFPPESVYRAAFARRGISPLSPVPLYHATAVAIVRRYMEQLGIDARHATAAFAAERVTPEIMRAVETLSGEIRYIALCMPGGEELARVLQREHGVAARLSTLPQRADLRVAFGKAEVVGDVLRIDSALRVAYDSPYPNELLAALFRAGSLDADALFVTSVESGSAKSGKREEKDLQNPYSSRIISSDVPV